MGCSSSSGSVEGGDTVTKFESLASNDPEPSIKASVQDEARFFRSTVGAIKMLIRNKASQDAFRLHLEKEHKEEFLKCFFDISEIMQLDESQLTSRTTALVWRYKALYDTVRGGNKNKTNAQYAHIWEGMGKLRHSDIMRSPPNILQTFLLQAQNDMLSRLVSPFESFLRSPEYREHFRLKTIEEKKRMKAVQQNPPVCLQQRPIAKFSATHPNVLIVDDSEVTRKFVVRALELDGHIVEKANNGREALDLMIANKYDVVLIDINMPVMDGFEAVRNFREHESKLRGDMDENMSISIMSDLSDISDSDEDSDEEDEKEDGIIVAMPAPPDEKHGADEGGGAGRSPTKNIIPSLNIAHAHAVKRQETRKELERNFRTGAIQRQHIIGMSSSVDPVTRNRALAAGMDSFLPKPFTVEKFLEALVISINARSTPRSATAVAFREASATDLS